MDVGERRRHEEDSAKGTKALELDSYSRMLYLCLDRRTRKAGVAQQLLPFGGERREETRKAVKERS